LVGAQGRKSREEKRHVLSPRFFPSFWATPQLTEPLEELDVFHLAKISENFYWEFTFLFVTSSSREPRDKDIDHEFPLGSFHRENGITFSGIPFIPENSSATNQKVVFHLHPNQNFRNFLVNGKRSFQITYHPYSQTEYKFLFPFVLIFTLLYVLDVLTSKTKKDSFLIFKHNLSDLTRNLK